MRITGLPSEAYPLTIEMLSPDRKVLWRETVDGPSTLVMPPVRPGRAVGVRVKYATGRVIESWP